MTKAIIFTGPGGIRARRSIEKFTQYCVDKGDRANTVEIDDRLIKRYLLAYPEAGDRLLLEQGGLAYLLYRPKQVLSRLWREVVEESIHESAEALAMGIGDLAADSWLFVTMHAVFYNNQSREFFSPVDQAFLRETLEASNITVEKVVTLIDDIHDVVQHLTRPGQLFQSPHSADAYQKTVDSILNLQLALDWRSSELLRASELASSLDVRHLVLAAKHEMTVVRDILLEDKPMGYISHPISSVRTNDDFKSEIGAFTKGVSSVIAPVSPTTIDELRIAKNEEGRVLPRLSERWPFPAETEVLFVQPANAEMDPLNPSDADFDETDRFLEGLIHSLLDAIRSQINARDRWLVDQANYLLVWRPFFKGHMSGGVTEEILHRNSLVDHGIIEPGQKKCIVYGPPEDLAMWRVNELVERARTLIGFNGGESSALERIRSELLADTNLFTEQPPQHQKILAVVRDAAGGFGRSSIALGAMSGQRSVAEDEHALETWSALVQDVLAADPLNRVLKEEHGDYWVKEHLAIDAFCSRVTQQIEEALR
ncbi:MAG TPA: hypothetical protein VG318_03330 [Actinomycetota bacterium]|nr:hypothetical protein [Actinomycetota bacterium]